MPAWRKLYQKTTESLDVNELPDDFTRLLWVLLPLGLDCEGRGLDNPSWIKAKIMPLRTDVSLDQIALACDCLAQSGMIRRYQVDGRGYFFIPTWHKYQGDTTREAASAFPPPPATDPPPPQSYAPPPGETGNESKLPSPCGRGAGDESKLPSPCGRGAGGEGPSTPPPQLQSHSLPAHDQRMSSSRPDSDVEPDPESEPEPDSASPAPSAGEAVSGEPDPSSLFRQSYDLASLTPAQEGALQDLTSTYGASLVAQAIAWAAEAGIPHSRALRAIRSALPGWRAHARTLPRPPGGLSAIGGGPARPQMLDVLDRLRKEYPHGRKP